MNILKDHRMVALVIALSLAGSFQLKAQNEKPALPVVKLIGFVKNDFFYDTRQTVTAREGHFLLFPAAHSFDAEGKDINAKGNLNMLAIQSNLGANFSGTKAFGADISGLIEGDFFGGSNATVNMIRLRHAYIKIQWPRFDIIAGQYWHPISGTPCVPSTISFNTGAPIHPISRTPQIRATFTVKSLRLFAALLSQRDNSSVGPDGVSSKYMRNSGLPEVQLFSELNIKKSSELTLGAGIGYKKIVPRLSTGKNYKTDESVNGMTAMVYIKFVPKILTAKLACLYLENGSEYLCLSGYAVKDSLDKIKGIVNYAPVKTICYWTDLSTNGKTLQCGLFAGYTQNLGTKDEIAGPVYLFSDANIKELYRISPRIALKSGSFTVATEIEYTVAVYGIPDNHCKMINNYSVQNTRCLLSVMYRF
jgi:hypothetical protein